ncbi:MAG: hypothetical protein JW894_13460 [Bacteroidales bacterium]|nr:hypothetical protein [Bacteroidales bacterium]
MKKLISLLSVSFLFFACNKDNDAVKYDFSDITETNAIGEYIGNVDESDWRTDDNWNSAENGLFGLSSASVIDSQIMTTDKDNVPVNPIAEDQVYPAYPNPSTGIFNIYFSTTAEEIEIVIVNTSLDIQYKNEFQTHGSIILSFSFDGYEVNHYYRIYYLLKFNDSIVKKGHGDIMYTE